LEHHGDRENIARPEHDLLAPVRIEQVPAVEADDLADQAAERSVRRRFDRREYHAKELRQTQSS
jgi:hypothetical protein